MPNGRPGDHPLNDMLKHQLCSGYPDDVLTAVRELAKHPLYLTVSERLSTVLWKNWPQFLDVKPDMAFMRAEIQELRQQLDETPD